MPFADRDGFLKDLPEQVNYSWLLKLIKIWLKAEDLPFRMGVLATLNETGHPASRTVAIRELNERGLFFFTQSGSAKVAHISADPHVSFTFMLPNTQRQIIIFGVVKSLNVNENLENWETYNQERRLRFLVYGTKSGQPLNNPQQLNEEFTTLRNHYQKALPEMPEEYVGYCIIPNEIKFYQLNEHRLSDSIIATNTKVTKSWTLQRLVP